MNKRHRTETYQPRSDMWWILLAYTKALEARPWVGFGHKALGRKALWAQGPLGARPLGARPWAQGPGRKALGARPWAQGPGRKALGARPGTPQAKRVDRTCTAAGYTNSHMLHFHRWWQDADCDTTSTSSDDPRDL